ncbi:MAG: hypothetical protein QGF53_12075 [Alphaproteobacteria bacterium]|nr:hypothetical protein [Alphaproteobacteria bacterium]
MGAVSLLGLGIGLTVGHLSNDTASTRAEKFGLSDLVNSGPDDDRTLTPREQVRERIEDSRGAVRSSSPPEVAGTKLMLRAIQELNPGEREILVRDLSRYVRKYPGAKVKIYALVRKFLTNNPQMAEHGNTVQQMLEASLRQDPDYLGN